MSNIQSVASLPNAIPSTHHCSEGEAHSLAPVPCRCGRFFSEDFDGRLFCRGCEGTDKADITPRLPFCHRA
jgi:hypothetical protein